MSDPIKDYAMAVAEAVRGAVRACPLCGLSDLDLDAIIATVEPPVMQHHAAPTCDGWWWAYGEGGWQAICVETFDDGSRSCLNCGAGVDPRDYDLWVPLLPPDTTESVPVAPPTPGLDPEEVRRALEFRERANDLVYPALAAAAREWLRLREQPAPDVQAQIASLSEQIHDMRRAHQAQIDAIKAENEHWRTTAKDRISTALADEMVREAVAREREECAKIAEQVWDSGNEGAHGGEQANRTAAAIRARSAKGVS